MIRLLDKDVSFQTKRGETSETQQTVRPYGRVSSLDPSQCHVETLLGDDCKATNMRHIDDSNPMRPAFFCSAPWEVFRSSKDRAQELKISSGGQIDTFYESFVHTSEERNFRSLFSEDQASFFTKHIDSHDTLFWWTGTVELTHIDTWYIHRFGEKNEPWCFQLVSYP